LRNLATNQLYQVGPPTYAKRLTFAETRDSGSPWYLQTGSVASLIVRLTANDPSGEYRLTLGEHVRWRLLYHTANQLVLEAPRGLPLVGFEDYFFQANCSGELPIYAFRPVEVSTAGGAPVTLERRPGQLNPMAATGMGCTRSKWW